ncbi:MAG: 4-alpha-glucanotransferase [Oscillibacter sp.]|nr:4-alpha-glucanotransferase [uncultured Oscillibacter sp.]MCI8812090.1 4-alpha-glucanotransferase [Oscillibacter sp.]
MRRAGILMPISALPSPCGIGTLGAAAREFADFLSAGGQSCWQILPVCPTSFGDSPYQSFSSYAGNPYFIDLEDLASEGLLEPGEFRHLRWGDNPARVDYGLLYETRYPVLRRACGRLLEQDPPDFARFREEHGDWLEDYALFMALKEKHGGVSWFQWPEGERLRRPGALDAAREELAEEIAFWRAVQYLFFRQWKALKDYANGKGLSIIGDLPIYVSGDSADVWANPEQFQLDGEGRPTEVAGCPPDGFSADGQLWGNPLFDWERMADGGYQWWLRRIAFQFRIYDTLRIDHFRGFDAYYAIPYGDATARNGRWRPGPGIGFFRAVEAALGPRDIIAEDLGFLTDSVRRLLEETGYPGMKVLEFAFDSRDTGGGYLPHCYTPHCVVYTGTHDNDTIQGWMQNAPPADAALARAYLRLSEQEGFHWGMMRSAWASVAELAVMQFQDLLGLGSEARMNIPSTLGGNNWRWRTVPGTYGPELAWRLRREMEVYQRLPAR